MTVRFQSIARGLVLLSLACMASACSPVGRLGVGGGEDFASVPAFHAVVAATVLEHWEHPTAFEQETVDLIDELGWQGVRLRIDDVLYDGQDSTVLPPPAIEAGDEVDVAVVTSIRPTIDQRYVFTLAYTDLGAPTWSTDLALTPTGELMDGFDTPATEYTLDAMLLEGETDADRVTALIEYVSEIDAYVNGNAHEGVRHAAVEAAGR